MKHLRMLGFASSLLVAADSAFAAEPYCVDNPDVIYCNDFESEDWGDLDHGANADIIKGTAGEEIFEGTFALRATLDGGAGYNAAEFGLRFSNEDLVYVRFYVRWADDWAVNHHWIGLHGDADDNMWSCHGGAGCRPDGELCLDGTGLDNDEVGGEPGSPFFYTYFPEMNCDSGSVCDMYNDASAVCDGCAEHGLPCEDGPECCWGNEYNPNLTDVTFEREQWYAVELMVAANTPGESDGEMALWVDGVAVADYDGRHWRDSAELMLNHFVAWNYYPGGDPVENMYYDNFVVSRAPIGLFGDGGEGEAEGEAEAEAEAEGEGEAESEAESEADADDGDTGGCGCQLGRRP